MAQVNQNKEKLAAAKKRLKQFKKNQHYYQNETENDYIQNANITLSDR
jgi:hypothetical protein